MPETVNLIVMLMIPQIIAAVLGFIFEDLGLTWHNPIGENFDETRTDCEASIAGESAENLVHAVALPCSWEPERKEDKWVILVTPSFIRS